MSEMIERVGKAMCWQIEKPCWGECSHAGECQGAPASVFLECARAAIAAMREPTEAMLFADHKDRIDGAISLESYTAKAVWESMIDAALGKPPVDI